MIRILSAILVFVAGSMLGFSMASKLKVRTQALYGWQQLLTGLDREIRYASTPLSAALQSVAQLCPCGSAVFCQVGEALNEDRRKDVLNTFDEVSARLAEKPAASDMLKSEDYAKLRPLFAGLGKSDTGSQSALIRQAQENVSLHKQQVEVANRAKARLFRTLGVLISAIAAVVLM